jgi:hypothetical protein
MGSLQTLLGAAALALSASPAMAGPLPPLVQTFAGCAGRFSAQMEHEWLMTDPASARTEALRAAMIELVEASMPAGRGREVLAIRIAAKQAHHALLTRATFRPGAQGTNWAAGRAEGEIAACAALLVS